MPKQLSVALCSQSFLPYTQSWIYRQIQGTNSPVKVIFCNQEENLEIYPFNNIVVAPPGNLTLRKIKYKLHFVLKHLPIHISKKHLKIYEKALIANKVNVCHVHFGVYAVELLPVCKKLNIPLVVTFHGFDITAAIQRSPAYGKALQNLFQEMTFGLAISQEMKVRLIQLGCPREKIKVSYLGVPVNEIPFVDRSHHAGKVTFLHVGRFGYTKGVPDLVDAFSKAFSQSDDVQLLLGGDGEQKAEVEAAIRNSPIAEKIKLLGKLSFEELLQIRIDADVFVLNSRTTIGSGDKEGLPIALLEASCSGLPIISTYHAGIAEGVLHNETGILVHEYDNDALANAMQLMMDQKTRLTLGKNGRALMENNFSITQCNEALYNIYEEATSI